MSIERLRVVIEREHNLARPFAPHRLRIYFGVLVWTALVFVAMTIGVGVGLIPPTFTADVVANLLFGIPVVLLFFVIWWDAPGEQRSRLEKAAELTLVWLPYTAFSQITYELPFLIGHPFGLWEPTSDPGWKWLWWQYALADSRYGSDSTFMFGLECVAIAAGTVVIVVWTRLIRTGLSDESRIRNLWLAFMGISMLYATTSVYFISEVRAGFGDIGQGAYGFWFKFIGENSPFIVLPLLVLYAIYLQIDYLTRRAGARQISASTADDADVVDGRADVATPRLSAEHPAMHRGR